MKPPANESPAPVGSTTSSSGKPGAAKTPCSSKRSAPCSPRLMMRRFGPRLRMSRAARRMLWMPESCARLLVVDDEHVDAPQHRRERLRLARDPEVHRVGDDELRARRPARARRAGAPGGCCRAARAASSRYAAGIFGRKSAKTLSCVSSVVRLHEVGVVAARPAERLARSRARRRSVSTPRARSASSVAVREVVADDARRRARARRATRRRPSRWPTPPTTSLDVAGGQLEVVEGHRTDDEDGRRRCSRAAPSLAHDEARSATSSVASRAARRAARAPRPRSPRAPS